MSKDNERIQDNNVENEPEGTESERIVKIPWMIILYTFLVLVITSVIAYMYFVLHKEKMGAFLPFSLFACVICTCALAIGMCRFIKQDAEKEEGKTKRRNING